MIRLFLLWGCLVCSTTSMGQNVSEKLRVALKKFDADPQMQQAISSLHVVDVATGQTVFTQNSQLGLAPASTLKLVTSATAYAVLGKDFRYETRFELQAGKDKPSLVIFPSGDPTLGSTRWTQTIEFAVINRIVTALKNKAPGGIQHIIVSNKGWDEEAIPEGWIWEDLGNYFGAGTYGLNWRENQYDVFLRSGSTLGAPVSIVTTEPKLHHFSLTSRVRTAAKGTGDKTLIFLPILSQEGVIRGTIPVGEQKFKVSGSFPNPPHQFVETLKEKLPPGLVAAPEMPAFISEEAKQTGELMHLERSPVLDSIIYWLNQKSLNLYAEALLRTLAQRQDREWATTAGTASIRQFWKARGIPETELNLMDGSGLSPGNRVTTRAQVAVLLFAKKQPWYTGFFASLPLYNGMKMKSGTIEGVKGFTGYHTSASGVSYAFSFLVNNFNGASGAITQKMYAVLNELK